jgi:hypothetical protein
MNPKYQSLDELMRDEEAGLIAAARKAIEAERPATIARLAAEEERRKTIPVWMLYDGVISGPYENDDAAIKFAEDNNIPLAVGGALIVDSLADAKEALKGEDDDDDEDADE